MKHRHVSIVLHKVTFILVLSAICRLLPAALPDTRPTGILLEGTRYATPFYRQETGTPGPTVVIVGGCHGDEPAGYNAAEQIRYWPIIRGTLIVVPRSNVPAIAANKRETPEVDKAVGNLNRNYPRAGKQEPPRGEIALALWKLIEAAKPDWVLDLHEGGDFRVRGPASVGSSVIAGKDEKTHAAAELMLAAVNATVSETDRKFVRLTIPVDGSLARAAAEHLKAGGMTLETTTKEQRLPLRIRQHRIMVHALLKQLGMIDQRVTVSSMSDRQARPGRVRLAVYDDGGSAGRGVPRLLAISAATANLAAAPIGAADIADGALTGFDVVVFPGGSASKEAQAIGEASRDIIRQFVEKGGGYVGICAGAYLACDNFSWSLHVLNARTVSPLWRRGEGQVKIELTDAGRQILGDRPGPIEVRYANGPVIMPADNAKLPAYQPLAFFRTELAGNGTPAGSMVNSPAIAAGTFGKGRVLFISPHPEQTPGLEDLVKRGVEWAAGGAKD